jgi:predicted transcriptional regulator
MVTQDFLDIIAMTTTTKTLNVRLPEHVYNQLEKLAQSTERTKSFLAVNALTNYLNVEAWQIEDIKSSLVEADSGEFATNAAVSQFFAKYDC